jgi:hypothetical protein
MIATSASSFEGSAMAPVTNQFGLPGLAGKLADAVSPGFVRGDPAFTVPEPFRKAK